VQPHTASVHEFLRKSRDEDIRKNYHRQNPWTLILNDFRIENTCDVPFNPFVVARLENTMAQPEFCRPVANACCGAENPTELLAKMEMSAVHYDLDSGEDVLLPSTLSFRSWPHVRFCSEGSVVKTRACNPWCLDRNRLFMSYADLLNYSVTVELWHHGGWFPNALLGFRKFLLRSLVGSDPYQSFELPNRHTLPKATAATLARVSFRAVLETTKLQHEVRLSRFSMALSHIVLNSRAVKAMNLCVCGSVAPADKHVPGVPMSGGGASRVVATMMCPKSKTKKPVVKAAAVAEDVLRGDVIDEVSHVELGPLATGRREGVAPILEFECSRSQLESLSLQVAVKVFNGAGAYIAGNAVLPLAGLTSAGVLPVAGYVVFGSLTADSRGALPNARFVMLERAREKLKIAYDRQVNADNRRQAEKRERGMDDQLPDKLMFVPLPTVLKGKVVGAYIRGFLEWRAVGDRLIQLFSQPSAAGGTDVVVGQSTKGADEAGDGGAEEEEAAIGERASVPVGPATGPGALAVDDVGAAAAARTAEARFGARVPIRALHSRTGFGKDAGFGKHPRLAIHITRVRMTDRRSAIGIGSTAMRLLVNFAGSRQSTMSLFLDETAAATFNHWIVFDIPPLPGTVDLSFYGILKHTREAVLAALAPLRDMVIEGWADSSRNQGAGSGESVAHMVEPPRRVVSSRFVVPFHRLIPYIPSEARKITQTRRNAELGLFKGFLEPSPDRVLPAVIMDIPLFPPGAMEPCGTLSARIQLLGLQRPDPSPTPSVAMKTKREQESAIRQKALWVSPSPGIPMPLGVSFVSLMPTPWRERLSFQVGGDEARAVLSDDLPTGESNLVSASHGLLLAAADSKAAVPGEEAANEEERDAGAGVGDGKAVAGEGKAEKTEDALDAIEEDAAEEDEKPEDEEEVGAKETEELVFDQETNDALAAGQSRSFPLVGSAVPAAAHLPDISSETSGLRSLWASFIEVTTYGLTTEAEALAMAQRNKKIAREKAGKAVVFQDWVQRDASLALDFLRYKKPCAGPLPPGKDAEFLDLSGAVPKAWLDQDFPSLPRLHHRSRSLPPWWLVMRDLWIEARPLGLREGQLQTWLNQASRTAFLVQSLHPSEVRFVRDVMARLKDTHRDGMVAELRTALLAYSQMNRLSLLRQAATGGVLPFTTASGTSHWLQGVHPLLVFYDEDGSPHPLTSAVAPIPMGTSTVVTACSLKSEFERNLLRSNHSQLANSDSLRALDLLENRLADSKGFRIVQLRHRRHLAWRVARMVRGMEFTQTADMFPNAASAARERITRLSACVTKDADSMRLDPTAEQRAFDASTVVGSAKSLERPPLYRLPPRYVPPVLRQVLMQLPQVWMRLGTSFDYARGAAAEHAALLCSLLLGIGEDAYVCVGLVRRRRPRMDHKTALAVVNYRRSQPAIPLERTGMAWELKEACNDLSNPKLFLPGREDKILGPTAVALLSSAAAPPQASDGAIVVKDDRDTPATKDKVVEAELDAANDATHPLRVRNEAVWLPAVGVASAAAAASAHGSAPAGDGDEDMDEAMAAGVAVRPHDPRQAEHVALPSGMDMWEHYRAMAEVEFPRPQEPASAAAKAVPKDAQYSPAPKTEVHADLGLTSKHPSAADMLEQADSKASPVHAPAPTAAPSATKAASLTTGDSQRLQCGDGFELTIPEEEDDDDGMSDSSAELEDEDPAATTDDREQAAGLMGVVSAMFGGWGADPAPREEPPPAAAAVQPANVSVAGSQDTQRPSAEKPVAQAPAASPAHAAEKGAGSDPEDDEEEDMVALDADADDDAKTVDTQDLIADDDRAGVETTTVFSEDEHLGGKVVFSKVPQLQALEAVSPAQGEGEAKEVSEDALFGDDDGPSAASGGAAAPADSSSSKRGEVVVVGMGIDEDEGVAIKSRPRNTEEVLAFWVVTYPTVRDTVESRAVDGQPPLGGSEMRGVGARHRRFLHSFRTGLDQSEIQIMQDEAARWKSSTTVAAAEDGVGEDQDGWKMSKDEAPDTFAADGDRPPGAEHRKVAHPSKMGGAYASECESSLSAIVRDALPDFWTPTGDVLPGRYQQGINAVISESNVERTAVRLRKAVERQRYRRPLLMFNHRNIWVNRQTDNDERRKRWKLLRAALAHHQELDIQQVTALSVLAAKELGFPASEYADPDKLDELLGMELPAEHRAMSRHLDATALREREEGKDDGPPPPMIGVASETGSKASAAPLHGLLAPLSDWSFENVHKKLAANLPEHPVFDDSHKQDPAILTAEPIKQSENLNHLTQGAPSGTLQRQQAEKNREFAKLMKKRREKDEFHWKWFVRRRDVASLNPATFGSLRGVQEPGVTDESVLNKHGLLPSRCCDTNWDLRDRDCWMPVLDVRGFTEERKAVADIITSNEPKLDGSGNILESDVVEDLRLPKRSVRRGGLAACFGGDIEAVASTAMRDFEASMHGLHGRVAGHLSGTAPPALMGPPLRRQLSLLETDRLTREITKEVEGAVSAMRVAARLPEGVLYDRRRYPVIRDTLRALLMARALAMNFEPGSHDRRMADTLTDEVRKRVLELVSLSSSRISKAKTVAQSAGRIRGHVDAWASRVQMPTDIRQLVQDTITHDSPAVRKAEAEIIVEAFVDSLTTGIVQTRFIALTVYAE
jgi:hypothetical protein